MSKIQRKASNIRKAKLRDLCDSKLSGLHPFDNMIIIHYLKRGQQEKGRL